MLDYPHKSSQKTAEKTLTRKMKYLHEDLALMGWIAFASVSVVLMIVVVWSCMRESSLNRKQMSISSAWDIGVSENNPLINSKAVDYDQESLSTRYHHIYSDHEISDDEGDTRSGKRWDYPIYRYGDRISG